MQPERGGSLPACWPAQLRCTSRATLAYDCPFNALPPAMHPPSLPLLPEVQISLRLRYEMRLWHGARRPPPSCSLLSLSPSMQPTRASPVCRATSIQSGSSIPRLHLLLPNLLPPNRNRRPDLARRNRRPALAHQSHLHHLSQSHLRARNRLAPGLPLPSRLARGLRHARSHGPRRARAHRSSLRGSAARCRGHGMCGLQLQFTSRAAV